MAMCRRRFATVGETVPGVFVMQSNSSLAGPTYLLVAIATLMLQLAIYDRQGPAPQEWIQLAIVMIVALVLRYKHQLGKATTGRVLSIVGFRHTFVQF